ncbi:MAG: DNA mismatch repair protein, partial [Nanoarchaeota archaeon]|nr:DNA mismatch repair protein [Nanoarchaeota archaeon]
KIKGGEYVGGMIDNSRLNDAITEDLTPSEYPLEEHNLKIFSKHTLDHEKGTILYFDNIKEGIRNSFEFLRKIMALYFRFSLIDNSFNIFLDGKKITLDDMKDLAEKTEFLWNINSFEDPYIKEKLTNLKEESKKIKMKSKVKGFIASVEKPRNLKITNTEEKVGIDLFVNGRLRERDILRHIPTDRIAESYLYGQIHFNDLDDVEDRFTTSRENIVADDDKYKKFLVELREKLLEILEDWDVLRIKNKKEGDSENKRISQKERSSVGLFNAVSTEYAVSDDEDDLENKKKVDGWIGNLIDDATYNFESYAECFISENLVRKHIKEKNIVTSSEANEIIQKWREKESENKTKGNISIDIRQEDDDLSYLDMAPLSKEADPQRGHFAGLTADAKQYKPIRDALMHTALLTGEAKQKLTAIFKNIKSRVKTLLSED